MAGNLCNQVQSPTLNTEVKAKQQEAEIVRQGCIGVLILIVYTIIFSNYKKVQVRIRKRRNQIEIPTPKTEVENN